MEIRLKPIERFGGEITVPGDKSISHRALILSSLTEDIVEIEGFLKAEDPLSTRYCLEKLGVEFREEDKRLLVIGRGLTGFSEPDDVLNAGNSGTTARLLAGVLAGQPFFSVLTGDASLRSRPMGRITGPLKQMGAIIDGRQEGAILPLALRGASLKPIDYTLPVASAQVKSAILLASLYTRGTTRIKEPGPSRDHTERMLLYLGGKLAKKSSGEILLEAPSKLRGKKIKVPGDISSAAFFMVAAALASRGELLIQEVGVNPTRTGIIDALSQMGATVRLQNKREYNLEPVADILVKGGSPLKGIEINSKMIPRLVDEIPILAVAALFARGRTVIRGASELRVKESDRLKAIREELGKMGAAISELPDGLIIEGGGKIKGACCSSRGDHRIAMALAIASLYAEGDTVIKGIDTVQVSFPGFFKLLNDLSR